MKNREIEISKEVRIFYEGKQSGLTDVNIIIWDREGNELVNSTMTEFIPGYELYYYDYTPNIFTDLIVVMDSTLKPKLKHELLTVVNPYFDINDIANAVWDEEIVDHVVEGSAGSALSQSSTGGGSGGLTIETHTVSDFYKGENAVAIIQVKYQGVPARGLTPQADIYKPDNTSFLSDQNFTEIGTTGIYFLNISIPSNADKGVYRMDITASKSTEGTSYSDDFEDQNSDGWSTTGATWVVVDDGAPQNWIFKKTDYAGFVYAYSTAGGDQLDFTYKAKVRLDSPGGNYVGIAFKYSDPNNTYDFYFRKGAGNVRLRRNGATLEETDYNSLTINFDQWYELKVIVNGGNIKCYVDDVEQIDFTDNNPLVAGKVGFFSYNSIASHDDVDVVPVGSSQTSYQVKDFRVGEKPLSKRSFMAFK